MPINLKYGQKAVERGFVSPQRLQQVLAKQRELGEQGKKVSIRMILEKAKLLNPAQLSQIDADLNIKVVKKQTGRMMQAPAAPAVLPPMAPTGAQDFAGDAVPEFGGMSDGNVDVTLFEPPPADMQDRIRAERDKAKSSAKAKQEADAAAFFAQNESSPFGNDPFAAPGDMAPEPFGAMQPEMQPDMQADPLAGEMQPEPAPMEPAEMDGGLAPEPMTELDRMDSSPKLNSLQAEFTGFASPDDEELPSLDAGFSQEPAPPARRGPASGRAFLPPPPPPAHANLAPSAGDFDNFGNDIISPEALEAGAGNKPTNSAPGVERTMFSPPPPGIAGREKTGGMDRTVFSPRPSAFGAPQPPAQPAGNDWDAGPPMEEKLDDPSAATVFSPPPPDVQARSSTSQKKPQGRQASADFANIELPSGKRMDDVPTAPATGEDVHPLRRSMTSSQSKSGQGRPSSGQTPGLGDVDSELPMDETPATPRHVDQRPVMQPAAKASGRGPKAEPVAASAGKDKFRPPDRSRRANTPAADQTTPSRRKEKKETPRVWLFALFFLIVVIALLVLPVALQESVPMMRSMREYFMVKPLYDEVEKVYDEAKRQLNLPVPDRSKNKGKTVKKVGTPDDSAPANGAPDNSAPDNGVPANNGTPG